VCARLSTWAIDRSAFIGTIMNKDVLPASQFMMSTVNGTDPTLKPWPYDPAKAKALVKEAKAAGVPVEKEIALFASDFQFANMNELLETLVQQWQEVGLEREDPDGRQDPALGHAAEALSDRSRPDHGA
jgi:peptide/nickel transport system substrate-binding protein